MSDSDLLEAAARAAGYTPVRWTDDGTALLLEGVQEPWNALHPNPHSDCMGDALRLAVKLGLVVDCSRPSAGEPYKQHAIWLDGTMSNAELTRRAIVRAATQPQPEGGA